MPSHLVARPLSTFEYMGRGVVFAGCVETTSYGEVLARLRGCWTFLGYEDLR